MTLNRNLITGLGLGIGISIAFTGVVNADTLSDNTLYVSGVSENDTLNIRNWETNEVIATLKNGERVTKKQDLKWKKGWVLVETSNGVTGICNSKYLSNQKGYNSNINTKEIAKDVELRTGAGRSYRIHKIVKAGTKVELISVSGDWAKVKFDGRLLYCPKNFVKDFKTSNTNNSINTTNTINENNKNKICVSSASVTTKKSAYESVYNAKIALKKLDGYTVNPGEKFSFYRAIGKVSRENGYIESTVINNGVKDTGLGGGICLASTTVFNAMIDAGIEPLQRRNHSIASSYVARGLDAMVSSGSSDLTFINKTGKKLTFNTNVSNGLATVSITSIGDHKNGCTYKARVEVYNNKLSADTYLQTIKDGKVISEKLISKSNYRQ